MSSIIEGYTNDIFISYRQKDNKGDRWVSEFVQALKTELEATFKEDISIYFDENPSDGLLETHDVDASLKEKLKCLIFIPVISQTYCDSRSFAWEHEFKAFIKEASQDRFGLKIALPNGNVSSRILPIRIHDLEPEDKALIENELGGVLRAIEFIYKEPGVNRPLSPEDEEKKNLNNTRYRNQINKTANAIKEIISGLKMGQPVTVKDAKQPQFKEDKMERTGKIKEKIHFPAFIQVPKKRLILLLSLLLCVIGVFVIYEIISSADTKRTVAVMPFPYVDNDNDLNSRGDIFLFDLLDKLNRVQHLTVTPRFSTLLLRGADKSLSEIRKELNANYLVDVTLTREANKISIWIELMSLKAQKALWSKKYIWENNQISQVILEIINVIANNLNIELSPEEIRQIEKESSQNTDANLNYISANAMSENAIFYAIYGNKLLDSASTISAIKTYDLAIKEDSLFAQAYARRAIARSWGFYLGQLDSTHIEKCLADINSALKINKELPVVQIALGFYYYYCKEDYQNAIKHFNLAADKDPENYQPLFYMALVYRKMGKWEESQKLIHMVVELSPQEALHLTNIGMSYTYLRNYDSALIFHQKAIDNMPVWLPSYNNKIETMILQGAGVAEARILRDSAIQRTGEKMREWGILFDLYDGNYLDALHKAENSHPSDFEFNGTRYLYLGKINNFLDNPVKAGLYYDSARVILSNELINDPDNPELLSLSGIAYAGLGNKEKAIEAGKDAVKLSGGNNLIESDMTINLAQIYTMAGEYDKAISNIEQLLRNPSCFSVNLLQIDPVWKPLADLPNYKTILREYSKK